MTTDLVVKVDRTQYHADLLTDFETLNQSTAHLIVSRCERVAWAQHPRLGGHARTTTPDMELGTIIDEVLLGDCERLTAIDFDDYRTNAAKAARDAALAANKIPVKRAKLADLVDVAKGLAKSLEYAGISFANMQTQVAVLWEEKASNGNTVQCRGLLDMFDLRRTEIVDLKSGKNNHPDQVPIKMVKYGYALQAAAYTSAVEHLYPTLVGRVTYSNVWIESDWPHVAYTTEPDGEVMQYGRIMWQRAIDRWEVALRTNKWPGYAAFGERKRVGLPAFAKETLFEEEGEEDGT